MLMKLTPGANPIKVRYFTRCSTNSLFVTCTKNCVFYNDQDKYVK